MSPVRIEWLDRLKGILILLVVLGHAFGSAGNAASPGWYRDVMRGGFKAIYLFHMPAFFFLAGLTFRSFDLKKKFRRLLVPYFAFGVVSIILYQVLLHGGNGAWWHPWASLVYGTSFPGTDGFRCNSVLWFLPCLFTTTATFSVILSLTKNKPIFRPYLLGGIAILSAVVFVCLAKNNCPNLPYGLIHVFKFLPFVIVGYLLSPMLIGSVPCAQKMDTRWLWGCFLLYVTVAYFVPFDWGMYRTFWKWGVSVVMGILGTLGCCALATAVCWRWLVSVGGISIGIMMIHKWFLVAINRLGVYEVLSSSVIAVLGSCLLALLIRRFVPEILGERR